MSNWNLGYVSDINYTHGYYSELNPNRSKLALLNVGLAPADDGAHCELGFGQGISINIHAAALGNHWYGNDFNPSQVNFAKSLLLAADAKLTLTDQSFEEFCKRDDLPEFASISLHGIWSWISDTNRSIIVDFIKRKLMVGGVVYISYNTLPGWASFAPIRHLLTEHASVMGSNGEGVLNRVSASLEFAIKLMDKNPLFTRVNPSVVNRLKKVADQNRQYLAHEYFNKDWHPMYFSEMNNWLSAAKISFACTAHYLDHIDELNLTQDQQGMLKDIEDPTFKESIRDFIVNQQFRRDYWIKGARKLSGIEKVEMLKKHRVVLISARADISLKISGSQGEGNLSESIYAPVLELMSDHKVRSIEEIADHLKANQILFPQVTQVIMVLIGAGHMASVQTDEQINKNKKSTAKLNSSLIDKARLNDHIGFLASPVTGGGIAVNRFEQLFLSAKNNGIQQHQDWAKASWGVLSSQNQRLIKDGKTIETEEDNLEELNRLAKRFSEKRMQILSALNIA